MKNLLQNRVLLLKILPIALLFLAGSAEELRTSMYPKPITLYATDPADILYQNSYFMITKRDVKVAVILFFLAITVVIFYICYPSIQAKIPTFFPH